MIWNPIKYSFSKPSILCVDLSIISLYRKQCERQLRFLWKFWTPNYLQSWAWYPVLSEETCIFCLKFYRNSTTFIGVEKTHTHTNIHEKEKHIHKLCAHKSLIFYSELVKSKDYGLSKRNFVVKRLNYMWGYVC